MVGNLVLWSVDVSYCFHRNTLVTMSPELTKNVRDVLQEEPTKHETSPWSLRVIQQTLLLSAAVRCVHTPETFCGHNVPQRVISSCFGVQHKINEETMDHRFLISIGSMFETRQIAAPPCRSRSISCEPVALLSEIRATASRLHRPCFATACSIVHHPAGGPQFPARTAACAARIQCLSAAGPEAIVMCASL